MTPFKKKAETRLAEARTALADTSRQIGVLEAQRNAALLADDDPTAARLYAELETLRGLARGHADRVALLEAEAAREEVEAIAKRRADLTVRFEKKLAQADAEAVELQELIAQAEKKFCRSSRFERMPGPHGRSRTAMRTLPPAPPRAQRYQAVRSRSYFNLSSTGLARGRSLAAGLVRLRSRIFPAPFARATSYAAGQGT